MAGHRPSPVRVSPAVTRIPTRRAAKFAQARSEIWNRIDNTMTLRCTLGRGSKHPLHTEMMASVRCHQSFICPRCADLSQLLRASAVEAIANAGKLVFHSIGDTGDERGKQMDFVAEMMTQDYDNSPDTVAPALFYHPGDVIYFAGDIDGYLVRVGRVGPLYDMAPAAGNNVPAQIRRPTASDAAGSI